MSRSRITKPATLRRLALITGRPIVGALARGGSDHAVLAYEADGVTWHVSKDGAFELVEWKTYIPPRK